MANYRERKKRSRSLADLLKDPYTLIIGKPLALKYQWRQGDTIYLEHSRQTARFRIAGVLASQGLALVEGGRVAVTDIATFQEFTGDYGWVDRIDLRFKPGVTDRDMEEISKILPEGVVLSSPLAAKESGQAMIRAYQLNLSILSFASLFVGMFLVYSLVALNAASRRHELAILRATGGSAYLLLFVFLAEGALFGIAGWIAAIPRQQSSGEVSVARGQPDHLHVVCARTGGHDLSQFMGDRIEFWRNGVHIRPGGAAACPGSHAGITQRSSGNISAWHAGLKNLLTGSPWQA